MLVRIGCILLQFSEEHGKFLTARLLPDHPAQRLTSAATSNDWPCCWRACIGIAWWMLQRATSMEHTVLLLQAQQKASHSLLVIRQTPLASLNFWVLKGQIYGSSQGYLPVSEY